MKYGKKVAAVLFVVAILSSMSMWAQAKDNNTALNFTGTVWVSKVGSPITLTFTSETDGKYTHSSGKGTFSCKADTITLVGTGFAGSYKYTVSGNTLTVKQLYLNTDFLFNKKEAKKEAAGEKEAKSDSEKRKTLPNGARLTATPAIGLSVSALAGGSGQTSAVQFDMGIQTTMIGFPIENKNFAWLNDPKYAKVMRNFTTIVNMDLAVGGQIMAKDKDVSLNAPIKSGALFQLHILAGYKLEPVHNLYITPALGMGFASSKVIGTKDYMSIVFDGNTFSIPLYADVKYFFTDLIGIDVNIINSFDFGFVTITANGYPVGASNFRNIFMLKVGPVFRL